MKITALKPKQDEPAAPKVPQHLKTAGRKLWGEVVETFELEPHDLVLLESMCQALDRKNTAERVLREHKGLTVENRHGELRAHPCVGIIRDSNILLARLRRELCLSEEPNESRPPAMKFGGPK